MATANLTTRLYDVNVANKIRDLPQVHMNAVYASSVTTPSVAVSTAITAPTVTVSSVLTAPTVAATNVLKTITAVSIPSVTGPGNTDLTAASVVGGSVTITGAQAAPYNLRMPTAAGIVAALPQAIVNSSFQCVINHVAVGQAATLVTHTGITLNTPTNFPASIARIITFTITNKTAGSEAVTAQLC